MPHLRQIASYAAGAIAIAVLCRLFGLDLARTFIGIAITGMVGLVFDRLRRREALAKDGWRYLTPGAMEWAAFLGCGAFALMLAYVYNFVGSARSDAARQMSNVFWLMIAFGSISIYCGLKIALEITRWNETEIQQRTILLQVRVLPWTEVSSVGNTFGGHALRLTGNDGTRIDIPLHRNGVESLLEILGDPVDE